jgi:hypothetical protein
LDYDEDAVLESDEEEDVDEEPGEPGEESGDVDFAELGYGGGSADGGQGTFVPVVEWGTGGEIPTSGNTGQKWGTRSGISVGSCRRALLDWTAGGGRPHMVRLDFLGDQLGYELALLDGYWGYAGEHFALGVFY